VTSLVLRNVDAKIDDADLIKYCSAQQRQVLEHIYPSWLVDAMVRVDIAKLNQIYADDFATIGSSGKMFTKKDILADFESFHDKLESFENGPMDVQVFGNVAVVHGGVTEKRIRDGKDTSGEFVWMDLLEKRAGKWVVVRSAGARVK